MATEDDTKAAATDNTVKTAPDPATQPDTTAAEVHPDDGPEKWLIICGGGAVPDKGYGGTIVVESHGDPKVQEGEFDTDEEVEAAKRQVTGYKTGADYYIRTSDDVTFPKDAVVLTLGEDLMQSGFWGFSRREGAVSVGPSMPAWAAANVAWQKGATSIEITGLTDRQKALIQPYIDDLPTNSHPASRADNVKITLT